MVVPSVLLVAGRVRGSRKRPHALHGALPSPGCGLCVRSNAAVRAPVDDDHEMATADGRRLKKPSRQ